MTPKRSWMRPVGGIAVGLGLATLASHFGVDEAFASVMAIALLVIVVLLVAGLVMRRRAASAPQDVADLESKHAAHRTGSTVGSSGLGAAAGGGVAASASLGHIPAGFDVAAFERIAPDQFTALQAANDARDVDRLRDYLTPDLFDVVCGEIAARADAPQKTEVFGLQAQVLNVTKEGSRYVLSVRFSGRVRRQAGAIPQDLEEVWRLVKPRKGFGGWLAAGIQQAE